MLSINYTELSRAEPGWHALVCAMGCLVLYVASRPVPSCPLGSPVCPQSWRQEGGRIDGRFTKPGSWAGG